MEGGEGNKFAIATKSDVGGVNTHTIFMTYEEIIKMAVTRQNPLFIEPDTKETKESIMAKIIENVPEWNDNWEFIFQITKSIKQ